MSETLIGLLHKSSSHSRPSQIAWAVVCGCICGLMPKTSLLFPVCLGISFLLPIHFVAACVTILITSSCTPLLHPVLGNVGHWLFQGQPIRQFAMQLDQFPLVPWFKLHNTVVMGTLFFSAVISWPLHWVINLMLLRPYANWLSLQHERMLTLPNSTQFAAVEEQLTKQPLSATITDSGRPPEIAPHVEPKPLAASLQNTSQGSGALSLAEAIDSIHALEDLLEKVNADRIGQIDASAVLARATKASELVDEILQSLDTYDAEASVKAADSATQASEPMSAHDATLDYVAGIDSATHRLTVRVDAPQTFQSHDTKISIYRRARTGETLVSGTEQNTHLEKESMPTVTDTSSEQLNVAIVQTPLSSTTDIGPDGTDQTSTSGTIRNEIEKRHEEALRHLLSHLRALKEKV